jgi:hypothetical protein
VNPWAHCRRASKTRRAAGLWKPAVHEHETPDPPTAAHPARLTLPAAGFMVLAVRRRPRAPGPSLLVSLALAATVGGTIYLAVTSLPYLALAPTTDPVFGAMNECLRAAVAERVGFAVSADLAQAAAWSTDQLARCRGDGDGGVSGSAEGWSLTGLTLAAFDDDGRLWTAQREPDGGRPVIAVFDGSHRRTLGEARPAAMVGTATGVVLFEAPGRLVALVADGTIPALRDLPPTREPMLSRSADGTRVALVHGGGFSIFDAHSLAVVTSQAPCDVEFLWWRPGGHEVILSCGPGASWGLRVDTNVDRQEALTAAPPVRAFLAGPRPVWVQACDGLPCSAPAPE